MNKAFDTIIRTMGSGNRHNGIYTICAQCYDRGLGEIDVVDYLQRLKSLGHYTDSEAIRTKASTTYKMWKRGGGTIGLKYKNRNRETTREYFAKSMHELFI